MTSTEQNAGEGSKEAVATTQAMFEHVQDLKLPIGSISPLSVNLSVSYLETRNITYAAVVQHSTVFVVHWDVKTETYGWDQIPILDMNTDKPIKVLQTVLVHPNSRSLPIVVVCTILGVQLYDIKTQRLMYQCSVENGSQFKGQRGEWDLWTRGVTCNDNAILVGTYSGEIIMLMSNGESSISMKKNLREHKDPVADLGTCKYDEITCSATVRGDVVVWQKPVKGVQFKIQTNQPINVINVLRKQVIIGTLRGRVLLYSIVTAQFMCQVDAHARAVTSISVAPESAYVLSSGEDCRFIVYKLHTRKPHAYEMEYRYSRNLDNSLICGAQFANGRGSSILVSCYDKHELAMYKIMKKSTSNQNKDNANATANANNGTNA